MSSLYAIKRSYLLAGTLAIVSAVVISYYPALKSNFYWDDTLFVGAAARMALPEYLLHYFNPMAQSDWHHFRPLQGIEWLVEYNLFGINPLGYHVAQIISHVANTLLLSLVVWELTRKLHLSVLSSLFYATLPLYSESVSYPADDAPLMLIFYLLTILFWIKYLRGGKKRYFVLAIGSAAIAILLREDAASLVLVLFLIDWLLVTDKINSSPLYWYYLPFLAMSVSAFILQRINFEANMEYLSGYGVSIGDHILPNASRLIEKLIFPWSAEIPTFLVLVGGLGLYCNFVLRTRNTGLIVLGIVMIVNMLPFTLIRKPDILMRYWYVPGIGSAVLYAGLFAVTAQKWGKGIGSHILAMIVPLVVLVGARDISSGAQMFAEQTRIYRLPYHDISLMHPTFSKGTYLYMINYPSLPTRVLQDMFFLKYGKNITVGGADLAQPARLHDYTTTYVYSFDEQNRIIEHLAQLDETRPEPATPVNFTPITLQGYEIAKSNLKRSESLVLLLYWSANTNIDKDYTVFVHLIDEKREMTVGADSPPRAGQAPTSSWKPNQLIVDWSVIPITDDIPTGVYQVEIGMYYQPTMQRLTFEDDAGKTRDAVMIKSLKIAE